VTGARPPAVAGRFYPADPRQLEESVRRALEVARPARSESAPPKALVVPHAGYVYSGPIAASAYARLVPAAATIRRVVLIGPSHFVPLQGVAAVSVDAFQTPLGPVPLDEEARRAVLELPGVRVDDLSHAAEHSLEVQLPFLQVVLDRFQVLPLAVGRSSPEEVAAVLDAVWGGAETVLVASTDLSHYHPYAQAVGLDRRTAAAILAADPGAIEDADACGAHALRGLLAAARTRALGVEQLDLRNSGDTAGDRRRVVGYGAFAMM
jgi:AmmeMemoRadiSam system protein B